MFGFLITIHVLVCLFLMVIILMQSGRGGGLTEGFAAAESMFGVKTNSVLVKGTTIFASLFLVTCLSLAYLSSKQNKSLLSGRDDKKAAAVAPVPVGVPIEEPQSDASTKDGEKSQSATTSTQAVSSTEKAVNPASVSEIKQATENANTQIPSAPHAEVPANPDKQ